MRHEIFQPCIDACNACASACDRCAAACLEEDPSQQLARCIALDLDCAAICRVAAGYLARGSELAGEICAMCALACERCADECLHHEHLSHCRLCADACRKCAAECRLVEASRAHDARVINAAA